MPEDNVIGLKGEYIPQPGKADPAVVQHLEYMLQRARDGYIHCIAGVYDTPDGVCYYNMGAGLGFDIIGGLEVIKQRIVDIMREHNST